jgi:hypothetical protein
MGNDTPQDHISKKKVVYQMPGTDKVITERDIEYCATDAGPLTMDVYYPPDSKREVRIPAVIIVAGYPDGGLQKMMGARFKEMGFTTSWGQLLAASGMATIIYTNQEPAADITALLQYVRQNAASLGIDKNRIGLWAASGNVPLALSILMREDSDYLKCAVLCYGLMLDSKESTIVADTASQFGFTNPCAGKSIDDLPQNLPLFIARAGQDQFPRLNETIDHFIAKALVRNLPVTLVNYPSGPHAFDIMDDSETSREIIKQILTFMRFHLLS